MWWRGTKSAIESFALGVQQLSLDMLSVLSNTARIAVDVDGGEGCLGVLWEVGVLVVFEVVGGESGWGRRRVSLVRARRRSRAIWVCLFCAGVGENVIVVGDGVVVEGGEVSVLDVTEVFGVVGGESGWGRRRVSLVRTRFRSRAICICLFVCVGAGEGVVVVGV